MTYKAQGEPNRNQRQLGWSAPRVDLDDIPIRVQHIDPGNARRPVALEQETLAAPLGRAFGVVMLDQVIGGGIEVTALQREVAVVLPIPPAVRKVASG